MMLDRMASVLADLSRSRSGQLTDLELIIFRCIRRRRVMDPDDAAEQSGGVTLKLFVV
jgi:hypothetical protein